MTEPPQKRPHPTRASVTRDLLRPAERDVLAGCLEACRMLGIPVERQNTGMGDFDGRRVRFGTPGAADISGVIPTRPGPDPGPNAGKKLAIETKAKGRKPTAEQLQYLCDLNAAGGIGFWVNDVGDCFRVLTKVLDGAWIEVDAEGTQWIVWDETRLENSRKQGDSVALGVDK